MRVIVSTTPDGGVALTCPTDEAMRLLSHGRPDGHFCRFLDRDWEIEKFLRGGISVHIASRWVDSLIAGGNTEAECYELIRDKDTQPDWTAHELMCRGDVPQDRWFRNAWARSPNGGPIYIDLNRARRVQRQKIRDAVSTRMTDLQTDAMLGDRSAKTTIDRLSNIDLAAIDGAASVEELRTVWPFDRSNNPGRAHSYRPASR